MGDSYTDIDIVDYTCRGKHTHISPRVGLKLAIWGITDL